MSLFLFEGVADYLVDSGAKSRPPQWKQVAWMKFCLLRKQRAVASWLSNVRAQYRHLPVAHDLFAEANYLADQDLKIFAPAAMIDISGSNGESPSNPSG